jgi:NAD(P)-dependent dehydrogenase (short-subunit alcohol dehydrogenase family)
MTLETLRFTLPDQRDFARLSGDFNPVHLDPIASRTIAAGEPIVHGMHLLLRALDVYFRRGRSAKRWTVAARFQRPALPGDAIAVTRTGRGRLALTIDAAAPLVEVEIDPSRVDAAIAAPVVAARRVPNHATSTQGTLAFSGSSQLRRTFPHTARALGLDAVAAIAALSRLVGMEYPGRDSLLSAIHLDIASHARARPLKWRVVRTDARFGLVRLEVDSGCVRGTVDAFSRPRPASIPAIRTVASHVAPDEFAEQRALIIGGSRGLGAAAALLVAAGGGVPLVTFVTGAAEVAALRRDVQRAGRRLEALRFDIVDDPVDRLARASARFRATHLYYFATPRIFARRREPFDQGLFERFALFYVTGFARACAALGTGSLVVFYPSSAAVEHRPHELLEYRAAKAAGEALCRLLSAGMPGLRILVKRLPRVATDQTASIVPVAALDPVAAMLPIVREMHRASRSPS